MPACRLPACRIVLAVRFHGKQYANVHATDRSLYQSCDSEYLSGDVLSVEGSIPPTYHEMADIAQIVTSSTNPIERARVLDGWQRCINRFGQSPYVCSVQSQRWFVDGHPQSISVETAHAKNCGPRGVSACKISQDSDDHVLSFITRLLPRDR